MRFFYMFLILSSSLSFAQTTPSGATLSKKKLVIIGDSVTEGYGVARDQAYPALLEKKIEESGKKWQVINAGVSGSTSASALSRMQWHLKQKPDLILLALGANDGLRATSTQAMYDNLQRAVAEAKKAGVTLILVGMKMPPNYGATYTKDFDSVFPRLAHKEKVPLLPFLLLGVAGHPELNQADGIHPNEKGHVIVANVVFKAIEKFL